MTLIFYFKTFRNILGNIIIFTKP